LPGIGGRLPAFSHGSGGRLAKNSGVAKPGAVPTPLIATTGLPAIFTSRGISPPMPK